MADEIRVTLTITYENGTLKHQYMPGTVNLPQSTKGFMSQVIAATTAEADLAIPGITAQGILVLHNLEATTTGKTFNWGIKSSTGGIPKYFRLLPKQQAMVQYGTTADIVRGKAASGALSVQAILFEY